MLAEMAADDFYFDSISQIVMHSWIKGRVTLVASPFPRPGRSRRLVLHSRSRMRGPVRPGGSRHHPRLFVLRPLRPY